MQERDREALTKALDQACPANLTLKVDAPVVLTHVRNSTDWHRGMEGKVVGFSDSG